MGKQSTKTGYYGCSTKREEDGNSYRLGLRDGIFGYWMTRLGQINETKSTRKNYFRGFIDGIRCSKERETTKGGDDAAHESNQLLVKDKTNYAESPI